MLNLFLQNSKQVLQRGHEVIQKHKQMVQRVKQGVQKHRQVIQCSKQLKQTHSEILQPTKQVLLRLMQTLHSLKHPVQNTRIAVQRLIEGKQ